MTYATYYGALIAELSDLAKMEKDPQRRSRTATVTKGDVNGVPPAILAVNFSGSGSSASIRVLLPTIWAELGRRRSHRCLHRPLL